MPYGISNKEFSRMVKVLQYNEKKKKDIIKQNKERRRRKDRLKFMFDSLFICSECSKKFVTDFNNNIDMDSCKKQALEHSCNDFKLIHYKQSNPKYIIDKYRVDELES